MYLTLSLLLPAVDLHTPLCVSLHQRTSASFLINSHRTVGHKLIISAFLFSRRAPLTRRAHREFLVWVLLEQQEADIGKDGHVGWDEFLLLMRSHGTVKNVLVEEMKASEISLAHGFSFVLQIKS